MSSKRGKSKRYGTAHPGPALAAASKKAELERKIAEKTARLGELQHEINVLTGRFNRASKDCERTRGLTASQVSILQRVRDTPRFSSYMIHSFQLNNLEYLQELGYLTLRKPWSDDESEHYIRITPEGLKMLEICEPEMAAEGENAQNEG
jgi:hypothetical protein